MMSRFKVERTYTSVLPKQLGPDISASTFSRVSLMSVDKGNSGFAP